MSEKAGIQLNTKTWHYKLIKFVLGDAAPTPQNMHNLCPYFWLLIFSMFAVVFVVLIKGIIQTFGKAFVKFDEYIDKLLIEPTATSWFNKLTDIEMHRIATDYSRISKIYTKSKQGRDDYGNPIGRGDLMEKWFTKTYNKSTYTYDENNRKQHGYSDDYQRWNSEQWAKRHALEEAGQEARRKRLATREKIEKDINETVNNIQTNVQSWTNIINWTKRAFGLIITVIGLIATYFVVNILGRGLLWSIENFNGPLLGTISMWTGIVILSLAALAGLIYVLRLWVLYVAEKGLTLWYAKAIYYPLYYLVYTPLKVVFVDLIYHLILVNIWIGIASGSKALLLGLLNFSGIFGEYFGASYTDYCPGIEWEENSKN